MIASEDSPYRILERKRDGYALDDGEIRAVVRGATDGSWDDSQVSAFLMAATIRGLSAEETRSLTVAMYESGERWDLSSAVAGVVDKHSTGGVGDKVSMFLAPLLAACGVPVAKLTGRGLGHTGGTADKLESIPGLRLDVDRDRAVKLLEEVGMVVTVASSEIAPADKRLYALRGVTATVESLPLVVSSILSKKLALGASNLIFDVKTGSGAFFADETEASSLATLLVRTAKALGRNASALVTDMSQPLGSWSGSSCEVLEVLECLEGDGDRALVEVTLCLCEQLIAQSGEAVERRTLLEKIRGGQARERFERWAAAQGADPRWLAEPRFELAPVEVVAEASRAGVLAEVATRRLGMMLLEAGAGRQRAGDEIDRGISLRYTARLGERVEAGQELARLYLRNPDAKMEHAFAECFSVRDSGEPPLLIRQRVS